MLNISDLKLKKISELQEIAKKIGLNKLSQKKIDLIYQIIDFASSNPNTANSDDSKSENKKKFDNSNKNKIDKSEIKDKKTEYKFSKFIFDSKLRQLSFNKENPVTLSPKESDLLELLLINVNDLTPREEALIKIWKDDNYFTSRSMDVYITKIRKYLSKDSSIRIDNIHGKGFKLTL